MKQQSEFIQIVIPCFNEGMNIADLVGKCNSVSLQVPVKFILVDNGSTDNTWEQIQSLTANNSSLDSIRILKNIGYGNGIFTGLKIASAPYIGWMHADLQTDPENLIVIANWLINQRSSKQIFIKGRRKNRALIDVFFSAAMSFFETLLFQRRMLEINAQPTLFSRSLIKELINPPLDFMLDLYVYHSAKKIGCLEKRFPISFGLRKHGHSSWNKNIFSRFKFIYNTVKYSLNLRINNL
jgi:glycosyltransferase involved in cell wall biosynthesis